ncbi:hypothetical protein CDL12_01051 [Handroanthus impetiginosus]|uniref:Uncharacterized protein n=1 Tax=Handroanthus impetiginosus TaxID=429701 RepID=A0A2G9I8X0_9LAMI|nr:hypothetical protein CDL12_01051 [Handroanthus impetiginosus]
MYCLGPMIPYFNLETAKSLSTNQNNFQYFEWLDSQPPNSVLYVSLGSFLSVSGPQMDEIVDGLHLSGVRFLWVGRGDTVRLREKCGKLGKIIPWCDQLKVLSHCLVSGFWTHGEWNSTIEGIFFGVPMITLPILADQTTTSKYIYEDWQIGWDAKREMKTRGMPRSGEISKMVKRFMDSESDERKDMMIRARELQKVAREAVLDGGSTRMNLDSFLDNVMRA